jgi:hypothetical protein
MMIMYQKTVDDNTCWSNVSQDVSLHVLVDVSMHVSVDVLMQVSMHVVVMGLS